MLVQLDALRAALRQLWRRGGYSLTVIGTLGLGIASVTAVWTLVNAVLLQPLQVPGGERVISVVRQGSSSASLGLPNVVELRQTLTGVEAISAVFDDFAMDRTDLAEPQRLQAQLVESPYFAVVAAEPILGRLLQESDDAVGAAPVVVLAEGYWHRAFGADPAVLGTSLMLSGVSAQIVGVAPAQADVRERNPQLWAPIPPFAPWAPSSPGSNNFEVMARLRADVDLRSGALELAQRSAQLAEQNGTPHKLLSAVPLRDLLVQSARDGLWALLGAVSLLLLLAIANVSALMLVQVSRRQQELAVRSALGANHGRLLQLLLGEGLLLGLAGGVLGLALAEGLVTLFQAQAAWPIPRLASARIDAGSAAVAIAISLASVLLLSAWPAWRATPKASPNHPRSTPGRGDQRALGCLMVVEIALACSLLGAVGLLLRSYQSLSELPLGFDPDPLISADIVLPEANYSKQPAQSRAFTQMVAHLRAQPGVAQAAMVVGPPLSGSQRIGHDLLIDGLTLDQGNARYRPFVGDYFGTIGLPLLKGRGYAESDSQGERVAWVNQRFVDRYLPGLEPIGQRIAWPAGQAGPSEQPLWMTVVGVVADVRSDNLRADEVPAVYAPYLQREASWIRFGTLIARTQGTPMDQAPALRSALASADGSVAIGEISALKERSEQVLAQDRVLLQLVGGFAALALVLGLQGVAGVVAFAAQQRRRELGLRMALGATATAAVAVLLRQTLLQLALGAVIGIGLVLGVGQWLSTILYGVEASDPISLIGAAALLVSVALLVAAWPAWRARGQDLTQVLRAD